jgi:hypothetical protein
MSFSMRLIYVFHNFFFFKKEFSVKFNKIFRWGNLHVSNI